MPRCHNLNLLLLIATVEASPGRLSRNDRDTWVHLALT